MATSIDPGRGEYWRKGLKVPESGHPYRHALDKVGLLLTEYPWRDGDLTVILRILAEARPDVVLDALSDYISLREDGVTDDFKAMVARFMGDNDELLRRLADG